MPDAPSSRSCSRPAPPPLQLQCSRASVVASVTALDLEAPVATLVPTVEDLGLLQPLFAAQTEAMHAELQALAASCLEEVVQPLHGIVVALQHWMVQVSGLLERMEAVDGKFVSLSTINCSPALPEGGMKRNNGGPFSSLAPMGPRPPWLECEEEASPVISCDKVFTMADVTGCTSEPLATMVLDADVLPVVDILLPELLFQGEEERAKVDEIVTSDDDMELSQVDLPVSLVGEVPSLVSSQVLLAYGALAI